MSNPRNNLTDTERNQLTDYDRTYIYVYAAELIDGYGQTTRFWFREPSDRQDFVNLWNRLHDVYGHETRAVIL